MNTDEIECFLAVVRYGNITNASKHLYISQSTISQKIKSLEEKVEVTLFKRSKGISNVTLTKEGDYFFKLALKWEDLVSESTLLKEKHFKQRISIGAVDSIHNFVMSDPYKQLVNQNKDINYFFRTHQSSEIYDLLESNSIDIGFLLEEKYSKNLIKEEYFKEDMVLVLNDADNILNINHLVDLNPLKEIFIDWGSNYRIWRAKNIGFETTLGVQVDTGLLLEKFLQEAGSWTIVPVSLAEHIKNNLTADILAFKNNIPYRVCYIVYSKYNNKVSETIQELRSFECFLDGVLKTDKGMITKSIKAE